MYNDIRFEKVPSDTMKLQRKICNRFDVFENDINRINIPIALAIAIASVSSYPIANQIASTNIM